MRGKRRERDGREGEGEEDGEGGGEMKPLKKREQGDNLVNIDRATPTPTRESLEYLFFSKQIFKTQVSRLYLLRGPSEVHPCILKKLDETENILC